MTTKATKPVSREVQTSHGPVIVTLTSVGIQMRLKGTRTTYGPIQHGKLFVIAAQMEADRIRAEKKTKPRASRGLLSVGGA